MKSSHLILLSLTFLLSLFNAAQAATYLVKPDGSGDFPTIQAAVDGAAGWDVIELADGVFKGPGNRDIDLLGKEIMIRSRSGNPFLCIIDPEGVYPTVPHRAFDFQRNEGSGAVDMGADQFYRHLYFLGDAVPGGAITIGIIGDPGSPALLAMSLGVKDPPVPTPHGDLYLKLPTAAQWNLGTIPSQGVVSLPANLGLARKRAPSIFFPCD